MDDCSLRTHPQEQVVLPNPKLFESAIQVEWAGRSNHLLDTLTQGILVYRNGQSLFANKAFTALLGFDSLEEVLALETTQDLLSGSHWEQLEHHLSNRVTGYPSRDNLELYLKRRDGSKVEARCNVDVIDWDDEPANMLSVVDITNLKIMDHESRVSRKLFRKIFDLSPDLTIIVDLDSGNIIDVNSAFVEITGLPRNNAVDEQASDLPIWADNSVREWFTHKMHSQTSARNMPVVLKARGGVYRQLTASAESVHLDGKRVLLVVARDISDDLCREQEITKARDDAYLASKTKSEFLANMSHEIRTPLNAILGFSEIISSEMLGPVGMPKYAEYAHDIFSSGEHLLAIINDILDLSKVEAGQLELNETEVYADEIVQDCLRLVEKKARDGMVTLHVDCPDDFSFSADAKLLKQVVLNMLTNAVKFTPVDGDVYLKIKESSEDLIISVRDTGIGMTEHELEKALKPFGQVDTEQSRKHQGSGLGLPLIQAFAQKMKGEFMLSSESGKGTTAKVILPLHTSQLI